MNEYFQTKCIVNADGTEEANRLGTQAPDPMNARCTVDMTEVKFFYEDPQRPNTTYIYFITGVSLELACSYEEFTRKWIDANYPMQARRNGLVR